MNILFISMYYYPEIGSSDYYLEDLKKFLISKGHNISVVAPNPVRNLDIKTINQYKNKSFEVINDVNVYRLFCNENNSNSVKNRVLRITKFKSALKKFLKENHQKFDYIYIPSNPPIFIPLMVEKMCKKYGIKNVYAVTDVWPNITGKCSFLKPFSKKGYRKADVIVTLSEDMKETIQSISRRNDIKVIRIWPEQSIFDNDSHIAKSNLKIDFSKVNISYIGNIGAFQNLDLVLDVAKSMIEDNYYHFNIVGSGRCVNHIKERIKNENISNISFINRVDNKTASYLYKNSDLNIISLGKGNIFYACPSKTSECIYSNKRCLLLLDKSKYSDLLTKNKQFILDSTYDVNHIKETIIELFKSNNETNNKGDAYDLYDKDLNLNLWLNVFDKGDNK